MLFIVGLSGGVKHINVWIYLQKSPCRCTPENKLSIKTFGRDTNIDVEKFNFWVPESYLWWNANYIGITSHKV